MYMIIDFRDVFLSQVISGLMRYYSNITGINKKHDAASLSCRDNDENVMYTLAHKLIRVPYYNTCKLMRMTN